MEGWYNQLYVVLLIISNGVAILQLIASIRWPRVARVSFFILFAWACWINMKTSQQSPQDYLAYADLTWSKWYRNFILGWFEAHIRFVVGFIAICQGLIALCMLLRGWIFKLGCAGGMVFLIAILPLGIGAGFPCTAIMALALFILSRKHGSNFVWQRSKPEMHSYERALG